MAHALKVLENFAETVKRDVSLIDLAALPGIVDAMKNTNSLDDRKMLLEHLLVFLSKMPEGPLATKLQNAVVELLYDDLPHPPSTQLGNKYAWRTADGSGNNISDPDMGKAGTPYARSVQQSHPLPQKALPDAGLVFDTLLRREKFVKHPAGLSSMMFSFAALVIHTVFRTSHENVNINETSSYVDLAPLYGHDQPSQDKVRKRDGRGLMWPDTFAEDRLLLLPPAVCVLLVLFNRNHNYIAKKLLEINERGTFEDPDSMADDDQRAAKLLAQEEELFQTARLINCGWFGSCVFSDYFSAILGLVRQGNSWSLNPFGEIRKEDHTLFERGRGNVCSVEFNCLYRWHATTSEYDEKWVETLSKQLFGDRDPESITMGDLKATIQKLQAMEPDCNHWTFGGMQRQEDGTFKDAELAAILMTATEHPAGAFKARGTPHCMRLHEIMGIEANRRWGVCSLNDFRKFLGLKPYATFLEWNSDPEVAAAAEKLYGNIDHLELYTGLQAEEAKPVMEGAGLCPSYTISRAILSDAIALTRGDRFFTADYTPYNLTSWGFADCQRDPSAPGYGSTLGRLFMRALPQHYTSESSYTWFPLMTPDAMQKILTTLGDSDKYQLARPTPTAAPRTVAAYREVAQVLGAPGFAPLCAGRAAQVISGDGCVFFLASRDAGRAQREQRAMVAALTAAPGSADAIAQFFYDKTRETVVAEAWTLVNQTVKSVDIVRDVLRYLPLYWASEVAGIRLTEKGVEGDYTPQELFDVLADIYEFLFLDFAPSSFITKSLHVQEHISTLLKHIKNAHAPSFSLFGVVSSFAKLFSGEPTHSAHDYHERLAALGYDADTLANSVLAVLVASVELSQALVHAVNFYLDENPSAQIQAAAGTRGTLAPKDSAVLQSFVLEALRLDPPFVGAYRAWPPPRANDAPLTHGDKVFVDIARANLDPDAFQNPTAVNVARAPQDRYLVGDGSARCLGLDLSSKIIAAVLHALASFPNVRRGPQQSGQLKRFKADVMQTSTWMYLKNDTTPSPWATSMVVQYD
ncbi:hypothetical protein PHLGIDRAFT_101881 [Phlebiopsis gigantea 11061_1 CR5-6]|uniref:Linoleate diol synthase n=1 Tax=Phlebiopsis gigantea (strain 11061_1 CR5-6) TaxID=745531 RepID=A0A0C3PRT0_PHLG1|nr:hypothetical protein PHLGIDRAFT_101881 [Phlebiopsis gigantea 11061_1 CR5-6]